MARIVAMYVHDTRDQDTHVRDRDTHVRDTLDGRGRTTLATLAEMALCFGPTVAFDLEESMVWVDVTGCGHLHAKANDPTGEYSLARKLAKKADMLGHSCRLVIADGPRVAAAIARHAPPHSRKSTSSQTSKSATSARSTAIFVIPSERTREALSRLPLAALPADEETRRFLVQLGLRTLGDVQKLPRASLGSRLGAQVTSLFAFLDGDDRTPLVPYVLPEAPEERTDLEYGIQAQDSLLFVTKSLCDRMALRLQGRAMAAAGLELSFSLDRALLPAGSDDVHTCALTLPSPLSLSADLFAVLRARVESVMLPAPALAVTLRVSRLERFEHRPLHLFVPEAKAERVLPRLVAELEAELGEGTVGRLSLEDRWEFRERSSLLPFGTPVASASQRLLTGSPEPTRVLSEQHSLSRVKGMILELLLRQSDTEWWRRGPSHQDHLATWIESFKGVALARLDLEGELWLEGWFD